MKGLIYARKGEAQIISMEKPACGEDTFLVQNIFSAVSCGTERNVILGGNYNRQGFPFLSLNYQMVAKVVECGDKITKFKVGDIVYAGTFAGYVEYHLLKESDLVVKIPEIPEAAYLGLASVAYHTTAISGLNTYSNVLVMGAGILGQFIAQIAKAKGANVTIADVNESRLELARSFHVNSAINCSENKLEGPLLIDNAPYDIVFETTGAKVLDEIIGTGFGTPSLMGYRSKLVLIAGRDFVEYVHNSGQENEIEIIHTNHFNQKDLEAVLKLFLQEKIKIKPLVSKTIKLNDMPEMMTSLLQEPEKYMGILVEYL